MRIIIIGGSGFVGAHLAAKLSLRDDVESICIFDMKPMKFPIDETYSYKFVYVIGDASNADMLKDTMRDVRPHIAIHLASWGMSGSPMIQKSTRAANIASVKASVDSCIAYDCRYFIYTSTYNVVFGGQDIINGDETLEAFPLNEHTDYYSSSKAEAERLVLDANNKVTQSGQKLFTCAIRPAAIYGEGEERHFPRIVKNIDLGIYNFYVGNSVTDWVHIDNLVSQSLGASCIDSIELLGYTVTLTHAVM
jgi:nucleoside-diphosphate-sugar epimerase